MYRPQSEGAVQCFRICSPDLTWRISGWTCKQTIYSEPRWAPARCKRLVAPDNAGHNTTPGRAVGGVRKVGEIMRNWFTCLICVYSLYKNPNKQPRIAAQKVWRPTTQRIIRVKEIPGFAHNSRGQMNDLANDIARRGPWPSYHSRAQSRSRHPERARRRARLRLMRLHVRKWHDDGRRQFHHKQQINSLSCCTLLVFGCTTFAGCVGGRDVVLVLPTLTPSRRWPLVEDVTVRKYNVYLFSFCCDRLATMCTDVLCDS